MVLAGIAAAVLLSSSPAIKDRKPDGRSKRSQSRSPQRGTGCRGTRSDRRSCAVGVDCGCIAEIATNSEERRQPCCGAGDSLVAAIAALFALPGRER